MDVAEIKMLLWRCRMTKLDKMRNRRLRRTIEMTKISEKIQERKLQLHGHVKKQKKEYIDQMMFKIEA